MHRHTMKRKDIIENRKADARDRRHRLTPAVDCYGSSTPYDDIRKVFYGGVPYYSCIYLRRIKGLFCGSIADSNNGFGRR